MGEKKSFVYIKHKDYAWIPAIQTGNDGKKATVSVPQYPDEQSIDSDGGRAAKKSVEEKVDLKHYANGVLPLQNVDNMGNLLVFPDMVELPYLHEVSNFMKSGICSGYRFRLTGNQFPSGWRQNMSCKLVMEMPIV